MVDLPKVLFSWFQGLSRLLVARTDNYRGGWPRGTQRRDPATVALLFRLWFSTWPGGGQVGSEQAQHAFGRGGLEHGGKPAVWRPDEAHQARFVAKAPKKLKPGALVGLRAV
jgi:hypothetical protein